MSVERFLAKVQKTETCWLWTGYVMPNGYGKVGVPKTRRVVLAHRRAFELFRGYSPSGVVMHTCDNRRCVNPDHLVEGTQEDNLRDMAAKGRGFHQRKTHCPQGHSYDVANTVWSTHPDSGRRFRQCRTCSTGYKRAWEAKHRDRAHR